MQTGDALLILLPSSAFTSTFFIDGSEGRSQFHKSFFTNLGITLSVKYGVNKPRPQDNGNYAFPSGHTPTFQSATFIHRRYGLPAYLTAAFVGWSRVEVKQHDWVDVFAGASLGVICSYYSTEKYKIIYVTPIITRDIYGVKSTTSW